MQTPIWLECGQGTVLHPVSKRPITTEVVELKNFGRIFEVIHYGNEPAATHKVILASPQLLALCEMELSFYAGMNPDAFHPERASLLKAMRAAVAVAKS